MAVDVPPLVLRSGMTIDDPLRVVLEFIEKDGSYFNYDLAPVLHDSTLTWEDIRVANRMIARMSPQVVAAIFTRAPEINAALTEISPSVSLADADRAIPWSELKQLLLAMEGIPGVGLARATKVLHRKRPALVPILDSVLVKYLSSVSRLPTAGSFVAKALALVRSYRRELELALPVLNPLQRSLRERGVKLSDVRLLDILLWGYSGTYAPAYLRSANGV